MLEKNGNRMGIDISYVQILKKCCESGESLYNCPTDFGMLMRELG